MWFKFKISLHLNNYDLNSRYKPLSHPFGTFVFIIIHKRAGVRVLQSFVSYLVARLSRFIFVWRVGRSVVFLTLVYVFPFPVPKGG